MPNYTSNLKLEKPLVTDNYDINVSNGNMDKIDLEVKKLQDNKSNNGHTHTKSNITDFAHTHSMGEITGLELSSTKVMRPNQKTVEQSISANETSILNLQNADGNLSQLQTSNKSNLVGAINELFQNANNGKSTIATAVGSPLSSGDTFSAMGSKIDTLTSKFKTNLNAKGVTVASGDKMSNLIDKVGSISTGKKWASGTYAYTGSSTTNHTSININYGSRLDFLPSIIFITFGTTTCYVMYSGATEYTVKSKDFYISNLIDSFVSGQNGSGARGLYVRVLNITNSSFDLSFEGSYMSMRFTNGAIFNWYAYE